MLLVYDEKIIENIFADDLLEVCLKLLIQVFLTHAREGIGLLLPIVRLRQFLYIVDRLEIDGILGCADAVGARG